jgi:hypothetical protein
MLDDGERIGEKQRAGRHFKHARPERVDGEASLASRVNIGGLLRGSGRGNKEEEKEEG